MDFYGKMILWDRSHASGTGRLEKCSFVVSNLMKMKFLMLKALRSELKLGLSHQIIFLKEYYFFVKKIGISHNKIRPKINLFYETV